MGEVLGPEVEVDLLPVGGASGWLVKWFVLAVPVAPGSGGPSSDG